jgi:hypothetical protein
MLPFGRDWEIAMYKTLVRSGYAFVALVALLSGASSAAPSLPLMPPGPILTPPTVVDVSNTFDASTSTGIGPTNMFYFQLSAMGKASLAFNGFSDSIIGPVNPMNSGGGLVVLSLCDIKCQGEMGSQPDAINEAQAKLTAPGTTPQTIKPGSETGPFADFFTSGAFLPAETNDLTGSVWELCFEGIPIVDMTGVTYSGTVTVGNVPETSTWAMMALGFAGLSLASVFSKKRKVVHAAAL